MYHTILVGKGKSSRVNIESLLDDYFYPKGKDGVLVIPVVDSVSQGQIFAAQYAVEIGIGLLVVADTNANLTGLPATSVYESSLPIKDAFEKTENITDVLFLWEDDDITCADALAWAKQKNISAKDLTNGLVNIKPADGLTVDTPSPVPTSEKMVESESILEDDEEEEVDEIDELYEALETLARVFAPLLAQEMKKYLR